MANRLLSGYLASAANALTTELNSLANNGYGTLGAEIDNSTNKYPLADFEFLAGGTLSPAANAAVDVWLLEAMDGTNYEDGTASVVPGRMPDFSIPVRTGTTITPRALFKAVILPPGKFKVLLRNVTGVALPASGNVLSYRPFTDAI